MEMLIIVLVAAAIGAYFLWGRKPAAAPGSAGDAPLASLEAYRQSRPSNFYLGKPTCSQCGSTFVEKGTCRNCGTTLFRG
ncbi:MAG TPA: hypothetical protein VLI72_06250 [Methylibium sp.]|nr:hypothetical protein [Methylibium sp.]